MNLMNFLAMLPTFSEVWSYVSLSRPNMRWYRSRKWIGLAYRSLKSRYDKIVNSNSRMVSSVIVTLCLSYNKSVMLAILGIFFSSILAAIITLVTAKVSKQGPGSFSLAL